jgi:hypothetical protein
MRLPAELGPTKTKFLPAEVRGASCRRRIDQCKGRRPAIDEIPEPLRADSMFFFLFIASPDVGPTAATRSSVVALLSPHQHPAFAFLHLGGDLDFQLAKLVFRLLD